MEKETITKFDIESAFKALDEIDIPKVSGGRFKANRVNLHERLHAKNAYDVLVEDYFDVNNQDDLEAAQEERDAEIAKAKLAKIEKIVDLDAESEEDILPSYVGKVIMQCPQCMTLFYKNEEDIETSEETPEVVNINEICQHCGNSSGYTLVGKVGGIDEEEAENFDMDEVSVDEDELNLDFPEGTEEVDAEGTGEAAETMDDELAELEDLDLAFEEEQTEEEEEPEEANESLHNSELLKKIEDKNDLKAEEESEHLTLNEEIETDAQEESDTAVEESLHGSEALEDAEKNSALKTELESEALTLNEVLTEDATDKLFDTLWSSSQPTHEETLASLKELGEAVTTEDFEEFDDNFDAHITEYLQEVYSNVSSYNSTSCAMSGKNLVVEGLIKFNSGKEKATKFVFEGESLIKETAVFKGLNESLTADNAAFTLTCKTSDKKLVTESFAYHYSIEGTEVKGTC